MTYFMVGFMSEIFQSFKAFVRVGMRCIYIFSTFTKVNKIVCNEYEEFMICAHITRVSCDEIKANVELFFSYRSRNDVN